MSRSPRPASNSFNRKPIAVGNRIRSQTELLAIQPYFVLPSISEFLKFLTNHELTITLFDHDTILVALGRFSKPLGLFVDTSGHLALQRWNPTLHCHRKAAYALAYLIWIAM